MNKTKAAGILYFALFIGGIVGTGHLLVQGLSARKAEAAQTEQVETTTPPMTLAQADADSGGSLEEENLLGDIDVSGAIEVPQYNPWKEIGAPLGLVVIAFFFLWINKIAVPFVTSRESISLYHYPTGVKRGLAAAVCFYGVAFLFGGFEVVYQMSVNESMEQYFANMSLGKIIAFTHAHLFGFTTSFLIVGLPFSMQFNHMRSYQWILPWGLTAAIIDVASWWGIKYISINFEYISIVCGLIFAGTYLFMLASLLRVLIFPQIILRTDRDYKEILEKRKAKKTARRALYSEIETEMFK